MLIDEVWAQEKSIIHDDHKYCGKFDGVGIYKGKHSLTIRKQIGSSMRNYLIQLCAYKNAHDAMYVDFSRTGCHFSVDEIGGNIKILNEKEIEEHTDRFYQHLVKYHMEIGTV